MSEFSLAEAQKLADSLIAQNTGKHLSDTEAIVFVGSWHNKKYEEIAQESGYSGEYLNKDIGNKFWRKLSNALQESVNKANFKEALRRKWEESKEEKQKYTTPINQITIDFPEGSVPANSPFYIERSKVEVRCCQEILKVGALIRIKAPHFMGKTSLLLRILNFAEQNREYTVNLNFRYLEQQKRSNLEYILKWLCLRVTQELKLENRLQDYWDTEILGSNDNCTDYFGEYILPKIDRPLVLGLDNIDILFSYSDVTENFCGMIRSWHEKAKISPNWQKLKLVISHSTTVYIPLDLNQSPFNIGIPIELKEFELSQIANLAKLYQVNLNTDEIIALREASGGHPHLVRLALYYLHKDKESLNRLLSNAATEAGIYRDFLRELQEVLKKSPELAEAYQKVVNLPHAVELDSKQIYQLDSLGLVEIEENQVKPRCNLYRQYFSRVLK